MKTIKLSMENEMYIINVNFYDFNMRIQLNDKELRETSSVTYNYSWSTRKMIENVIGVKEFTNDILCHLVGIYEFFKEGVNAQTGSSMLDDFGFEYIADTALGCLYEESEYNEDLDIWI